MAVGVKARSYGCALLLNEPVDTTIRSSIFDWVADYRIFEYLFS